MPVFDKKLLLGLVKGMVGGGAGGLFFALVMSIANKKPLGAYVASIGMFAVGGLAQAGLASFMSPAGSGTPPQADGSRAGAVQLPIVVENRLVRVVTWIGIIVFLPLGAGAAAQALWWPFLVSVGLALYVTCVGLIYGGVISADREGVSYSTGSGFFFMPWSQVSYLEADERRTTVVLASDTQRFPVRLVHVSGPKDELLRFIEEQAAQRQLPIRVTSKAQNRLFRNVRVRGARR